MARPLAEGHAQPVPDNSACPRCGGGFHCGVADGHCDCFDLRLTPAMQAQLARDYPGQCLCLRCLATLAAMADTTAPAPGEKK
jgi:hypothetical protein